MKAFLECVDWDGNDVITSAPRKRELASYRKNVKKIRDRAKLYSAKLNDRMVRRHKRLHKAENVKLKDNVLIRYRPQKGGSLPPKNRFVVKGTVVKKSKKNHDIYKVRFVPPNSNEQIEERISVENIASIRKREIGNTSKKKQGLRELRKKLMIPLTACDRFLERDFPHMSITLMHSPPDDENYQFGALCFWLNRLGIH